jgi:hypothetical protein
VVQALWQYGAYEESQILLRLRRSARIDFIH